MGTAVFSGALAWVDYDLSSDKKLVARIHQICVNTARA